MTAYSWLRFAVALLGCLPACTANRVAPPPVEPESAGSDLDPPNGALGLSANRAAAEPAPTWADATMPPPTQGDDRLACSFFWRKSDGHSFRKGDQRIVELDTVGTKGVQLHDFEVAIEVDASNGGGRVLHVVSEAGPAEISEHYDFGTHNGAAHLPGGGHGFTGLRYLTHPTNRSEMQFWCGSYDAKADVTDEMAAQESPGPVAPEQSVVECTASLLDADANPKDSKTFTIANEAAIRLGEFELRTHYFPGEYDSGGVGVDVSAKGMPNVVHSLYQLDGRELPANIITGSSFTGVQEVRSVPSGERLSYSCRTRSPA